MKMVRWVGGGLNGWGFVFEIVGVKSSFFCVGV